MTDKFNIKSLLLTGLILTFLNATILFVIIGKGIYDNIAGKETEGKIVLANLDSDVANEITKQFTYKAASNGNQEYYSPSLDALITYSSDNYFVSEYDNSIAVSIKGAYDFDTSAKIRISETMITPAQAQSDLEKIYTSVKLEEETEIEGLTAVRFTYVKVSYIDGSKAIFKSLYIQREMNGRYLYVVISSPERKDITAFESDIARILSNIDVNPKDIPQNISVSIPDLNLTFEYDKDLWRPSSITKSSTFLEFLSQENESNTKNKYSTTTISIIGSAQYGDTALEDHHKLYADYQYLAEIYDNFQVVKNAQSTKFNGSDSYYSEITYESFGDLNTNRIYTFFSPDKRNVVTIKMFTSKSGTDGETALTKVVESIKFTSDDLESTLNNPISSILPGNVLGSSSVTIDKSTLIGKPSVERIYNRTCVNVKVDSTTTFTRTTKGQYNLCTGSIGTGFYVSSDGYLVSNGHVATPNSIDTVVNTLMSSNPPQFWTDFALDLSDLLYREKGINLSTLSSTDILYLMLGVFIEFTQVNDISLEPTHDNYIIVGDNFDIDRVTFYPTSQNSSIKLTTVAGQVDSSVMSSYNIAIGKEDGTKTPDLSILKVENSNSIFPSLRLSEEKYITSGMQIHVLGFPAAVDASTHLSSRTSNIPTVTSGTISAVKQSQGGRFNLIQVDASVSGGNSGGPILNSNGEVVAVTTYGLNTSGGADYNFGVSVDEVTRFLEDNDIQIKEGEVTKYLISGAENLEKSYFKYAIKDFKMVAKLYPKSEETLTPLIAITQKKIDEGVDKTPLINTIGMEKALSQIGIKLPGNTLIIAMISTAAFALALIFMLLLLSISRGRNRMQPSPIVGNVDTPIYIEKVQRSANQSQENDIQNSTQKPLQQDIAFPTPPQHVRNPMEHAPVKNNAQTESQTPSQPQSDVNTSQAHLSTLQPPNSSTTLHNATGAASKTPVA